MEVYRYVSIDELNLMTQNRFSEIGYFVDEKPNFSNTHHYKKGVRYMHFFRKLSDLNNIRSINPGNNNMYLCKFDIPASLLLPHFGIGYYDSHTYDYDYETLVEFAVPSKKINFSHLVSCAFDKDQQLTPETAKKQLDEFELKYKNANNAKINQ